MLEDKLTKELFKTNTSGDAKRQFRFAINFV